VHRPRPAAPRGEEELPPAHRLHRLARAGGRAGQGALHAQAQGGDAALAKRYISSSGKKNQEIQNIISLVNSRALRDGHFYFGRDRDEMDLKTAVSGRDRSGWDFLRIILGFFRMTKYFFFFQF
jgi:hypothetical protein